MALEILDVALVLFSLLSGVESSEISSLSGLWILFSRIKTIFAALKLAYHFTTSPTTLATNVP